MTEKEKEIQEESFRQFQERMNLPICTVDLTEEELEELREKGLI